MDTQHLTDDQAFSGFKARLHTMGSTAIGAEAVLASILVNRALNKPARNGTPPGVTEEGNPS